MLNYYGGGVGSKVAEVLIGSFHGACARVCTYARPTYLEEDTHCFTHSDVSRMGHQAMWFNLLMSYLTRISVWVQARCFG